ncbi:MAG: UDP-glucose 4-epimerase GalE [Sorangiineae bacterium NIC37A_2]|nr:MAG: UDP-glucose 4-epimerase GalE [Sorangiineae bacterium NIC37A_2]
MRVLVTGGAGYIGSHALRALLRAGHSPVAYDNLSRGHRAAVPKDVPLIEADIRDTDVLTAALKDNGIDCVMHFAAFAYVGESVELPLLYYNNNSRGTLSVLEAIDRARTPRLVFSSTCATYGNPPQNPIVETTVQRPINPYGMSKLVSEYMISDYAASRSDFSYAALRYFNVAGSSFDGEIGEDHDPETHLIPVILQAALGRREKVTVFGDDYPTPDGTCIRDYIHVEDLVSAHVRVMEALKPSDRRIYNLGIGRGHSVREIIDAARRVTGVDFKVEIGPRRAGDPASLYSDPSRIHEELGWRAQHTDIEETIRSAYQWFSKNPNGYGDAR